MCSIRSEEVKTAVEFLNDVKYKGFTDSVVKRYMKDKRGLTDEEIEKAFSINRNQLENGKGENERTKSKKQDLSVIGGKSDRPEVPTSFAARNQVRDVNFLLPSKRAKGQQLINEFLDSEKSYCDILQTLNQKYYPELVQLSGEGRFEITRREVEDIFRQVPDLLKLHNRFFEDIKQGSSIGGIFLKLFKSFEGYASYLKDCQQTVNKMRKYIKDTKFYSCVARLNFTATGRKGDLVDYLLTPLERFMDYKDFLDKLYGWADTTWTTEYEILGKAARRMGRVAKYIEKYKYGICNQNEMNKVQKFLGNQCDILVPERAIIRRGMMIRRKSGWTSRRQRYVFFLFNDMFLWTTKNGKLKDAIHLRNCEVMPSSSKNKTERRLNVIFFKEKQKILKLECETLFVRNTWYEALKKTISTAKEACSKAWSKSDLIVNMKFKDYLDDFSDDESKDVEDSYSRVEPSEDLEDTYNKRYAVTSNFLTQHYEDMDPMGDNISHISEDLGSFADQRKYMLQNSSTSAQLSPFDRLNKNKFSPTGHGTNVILHNNATYDGRDSAKQITSKQQKQGELKDSPEFTEKRKKSNIIRVDSAAINVELPRKLTLRLDNF